MPRPKEGSAAHQPKAPESIRHDDATTPWKEPCQNKKQKKRVLSGEQALGGKRTTERRTKSAHDKDLRQVLSSLIDCFDEIVDPRINRRRRHLLIDIMVVAMFAVIANADAWKDMQIWAQANEAWLRRFLELPNGIPSRDTLRRTISRLDPDAFQSAFLRWLGGLKKQLGGVIAIDGKALRRSGTDSQNPLHIVSAWASQNHLTLGQKQVDKKSNEITAIPELLSLLELSGAIVTIDAMGCQKAIAAQIIEGGGDYCLAVKDNQETLAYDIRTAFESAMESGFAETTHEELDTADRGHGREEKRHYCVMPVPETLRTAGQWKGLKSLGLAITYRGPNCDGEVRYFICSFECHVQSFAAAVRDHWGIENSLHWVMDVTFREDDCRIHKDHGGENMSWLRRLAISVIKQDTSRRDTIRAKRVRAGYDVNYLAQLLNAISTDN